MAQGYHRTVEERRSFADATKGPVVTKPARTCILSDMMLRRSISALLLAALVLGQAMPAHAGRMLCRMKAPAPAEACSRCDSAPANDSSATLRASNCCRIAPAESAESPPVVLSSLRRAQSCENQTPVLALQPASSVAGSALAPIAANVSPLHPPILESTLRSTVLRN